MTLDPQIMKAVERLDCRVTVGDVATQTGLELSLAESGLLALASAAGGHLQVAETGDVVYLFPKEFRAILRNKSLRLQLQAWWQGIWRVLFYLIRISFGIVLIASILLIMLAIAIILIAATSSRDGDSDSGGSSDVRLPNIWISPDFFWIFYPDYGRDRRYEARRRQSPDKPALNFLEAVFSFLFGDGDPNADLDERRWQAIGTTIRNNGGAIAAEQLAPYLDIEAGQSADVDEAYMLPVLTRFNGRPQVSPEGQLVYQFPDLQTTAVEERSRPVAAYLKEQPYRFSQATAGQLTGAMTLGTVNLVGALALGYLLADGTVAAQLGGLVAFVASIFWVLLAYGVGFLTVPLIRFFWIKAKNRGIEQRNRQRQERAIALNEADDTLQAKLNYAQDFATATTYIGAEDLIYSTERDLIEQEIEQADRIDAEWQQRLEGQER